MARHYVDLVIREADSTVAVVCCAVFMVHYLAIGEPDATLEYICLPQLVIREADSSSGGGLLCSLHGPLSRQRGA
ncbi:hypothetical protein J6590_082179 [Homalodisca vitripennis]|nr:hypothetical protein J6590_082179 [Homalodisca vitripennis]